MPPRDFNDEFLKIKEILGTLEQDEEKEQSESGFSFEQIMSEERYEAVTTTKRKKNVMSEDPDSDTQHIVKIVDEMKKLSATTEKMHPTPAEPAVSVKPPGPDSSAFFGSYNSAVPAPSAVFTPPAATAPVTAPVKEENYNEKTELPEFTITPDFAAVFAPLQTEQIEEQDDFIEDEVEKIPRESILSKIIKHIRKPLPPLEAMPDKAYQRVTPYVNSIKIRTIAAFILSFPLFYVALAPVLRIPIPNFLVYTREPYKYIMITSILLILIMFCAVDIIAKGLSDLYHLRPGAETLVTISCFSTLMHVFSLIIDIPLFENLIGFIPYTTVSGISVFFTLWASFYQYNAYKRTYATYMQSEHRETVVLEHNLWNDSTVYTKCNLELEGFVSRTESSDLARRFSSFFAPLLMVTALVFAVAASIAKGRPGFFFWAWSAISLATVPLSGLFVFSLPFSRVAKRLNIMGGAIAGWAAARSLRDGEYILLKDGDFFPNDLVTLNGLKVYNDISFDTVISYASSTLYAADSGLIHALYDKIKDYPSALREVDNLEHHDGGGLSCEIANDHVLLGNYAFLLRMGVRLPNELNIKRAVYLVINRELAAIFAFNYIPSDSVSGALKMLLHRRLTPLVATRDFGITPAMLKEKYDLDPDTLEYPTTEERLTLSEKDRRSYEKPDAFVSRNGLSAMAECAVGASRLHKVAVINLFFYIICTVFSVFAMFYLTSAGTSNAALSIVPGNVLIYLLLWWIPVWIVSSAAHRY